MLGALLKCAFDPKSSFIAADFEYKFDPPNVGYYPVPGTGRKGENSSIMIEGVGEIIVGAGENSQDATYFYKPSNKDKKGYFIAKGGEVEINDH